MSPRIYIFILFLLPVLARKTGGGGVHHGSFGGGHSGGYSGGHSGGYGGGHQGGFGGQNHGYPPSPGLSGTHSNIYSGNANPGKQGAYYPPSETGLSGHSRPPHSSGNHRTDVHRHHYTNHYHYHPPQQINYGSTYHPVYRGTPPLYIYEYRDSGSRFDTLLTGLALYNLGRMSAGNNNHHNYREYNGSPGEKCKFIIQKNNGDYEETRIDCKLMSSFIWDNERTPNSVEPSKTVSVTSIEKTITVNNDSSVTTIQNKTVVVEDALKVKGPSISVTPGMICFMVRVSRDSSKLQKQVDCGLLQTYAMTSFRSDSSRNISVITSLITLSCVLRLLQ